MNRRDAVHPVVHELSHMAVQMEFYTEFGMALAPLPGNPSLMKPAAKGLAGAGRFVSENTFSSGLIFKSRLFYTRLFEVLADTQGVSQTINKKITIPASQHGAPTAITQIIDNQPVRHLPPP